MIKLILIDPAAKTIEFAERKENTLEDLYSIVGCESLEGVDVAPNLTLMFDEEAKVHGNYQGQFIVQDQFPILGKGILCRSNVDGDNIDSTDEDLELARKMFSFG